MFWQHDPKLSVVLTLPTQYIFYATCSIYPVDK